MLSVMSNLSGTDCNTFVVIPGRGLLPASPESITVGRWLWIAGSAFQAAPE
jgi:hypothetical protein